MLYSLLAGTFIVIILYLAARFRIDRKFRERKKLNGTALPKDERCEERDIPTSNLEHLGLITVKFLLLIALAGEIAYVIYLVTIDILARTQ